MEVEPLKFNINDNFEDVKRHVIENKAELETMLGQKINVQ